MGRTAQTSGLGWRQYAACAGSHPDLFFPERGGSQEAAKEVCRRCVVRLSCLDEHINEKWGVWGGLSERERRRLRRARIKSPDLRLVG